MGVARYREDPAPPGSGLVCLWSREAAAHAGPQVQRVVPDGCVDLIWWSGDARVTVAGPDTGPDLAELRPGERLVGIRFGPGAAPPVLGVPADAVRDGRLPLRDLWGADADRLGEAVAGSPSPHAVLAGAALARAEGPPDPIVPAVVRALSRGVPVRDVAGMLGLGERQLRRRASAAFGGTGRRPCSGCCVSSVLWRGPGRANRWPRWLTAPVTPTRRTWRMTCATWRGCPSARCCRRRAGSRCPAAAAPARRRPAPCARLAGRGPPERSGQGVRCR
ncbi:hypothetical protein Acsp04_09110 [Actinomadura sp. NBRC 104425]|nr:hypothetical protein Acsp04_09110 [Actinomadura sp. NBRC 104425]